jgi:hypothetical protein
MFNVVNAYTRGWRFEGLPAESSYRLQKMGGMILENLGFKVHPCRPGSSL